MYGDIGVFHYYHPDRNDSLALGGVGLLTVNFENRNQRYGKVEGSFDVLLPYGATAQSLWAPITAGSSDPDPSQDSLTAAIEARLSEVSSRAVHLFTWGNAPLLLNVRELYFSAFLPWADVAMGRQIINFGKGFLFSPLDAFSVVDIADISFRRSGSDVLNVRIPLGMLSGIDIVAEAPMPLREHTTAVKLFGNIFGWDISGVTLYRHRSEEVRVGMGFKGDIVAGLYGEIVGSFETSSGERSVECMLGSDYSIGSRWVFAAEYAYNQAPNPETIWTRNNLFLQSQCIINDLMNVSINGILAIEKERVIGTAIYSYNILQNVDLTTYLRGYRNITTQAEVHDLEYALRMEVRF